MYGDVQKELKVRCVEREEVRLRLQDVLRAVDGLLLVKVQLNLLQEGIAKNRDRHALIALEKSDEVVEDFLSNIDIVILFNENESQSLVKNGSILVTVFGKLVNQSCHQAN